MMFTVESIEKSRAKRLASVSRDVAVAMGEWYREEYLHHVGEFPCDDSNITVAEREKALEAIKQLFNLDVNATTKLLVDRNDGRLDRDFILDEAAKAFDYAACDDDFDDPSA